MYASKLFTNLITLKKQHKEIAEFRKFINSPYFNSKKEVIELFIYIKKYWNSSKESQKKNLDKKKIFKKIFPQFKEYSRTKMNLCISNLSKLLDDFFIHQELKKNKMRKNILLADALKERGLDLYYFKKVGEIEKEFEIQKATEYVLTPSFYYNQVWLNEHIYYHPNHEKRKLASDDVSLENMIKNLDIYYTSKLLQFACEAESRKKIYGKNYSIPQLKSISRRAKKEFNTIPFISTYLSIIKLFVEKDPNLILSTQKQVYQIVNRGKKAYSLDFILKFFNALPSFKERLVFYYQLYLLANDKGLLIENGFIDKQNFENILHIAFALKEYEFIDEFMKKMKPYLSVNEAQYENIEHFCAANLEYKSNKYKAASVSLAKVKFDDFSYGIRCYTLFIRIIVDSRKSVSHDFETTERNFKHYLWRKTNNGKLSTKMKAEHHEFIKLSKAIYYRNYKPVDKEKMLKSLKDNPGTPASKWLKNWIETI